jgi:hypothetical protein
VKTKMTKLAAAILCLGILAGVWSEPAGAASPDVGDRCLAYFIGCLAGSAVLSGTDWPVDLLSFADLIPGCLASYLWCEVYSG